MAKSGAPGAVRPAFNTPGQQEQCQCAASNVSSSPTTPGQAVGWKPINQPVVAQEGSNMMQNYQQRIDAGYNPRQEWLQQRMAQQGPAAPFQPSWMTAGQQAGTQLSAPGLLAPAASGRNYIQPGILAGLLAKGIHA